MKSSDISIGTLVEVRGYFNVFIRHWRGRVLSLPMNGKVKVQRISYIDGRNLGEPCVVETRDCTKYDPAYKMDDFYAKDERVEQEDAERRDEIIAALRARGVPFSHAKFGPEIEFAPGDGFKWLALALGVESPGPGMP